MLTYNDTDDSTSSNNNVVSKKDESLKSENNNTPLQKVQVEIEKEVAAQNNQDHQFDSKIKVIKKKDILLDDENAVDIKKEKKVKRTGGGVIKRTKKENVKKRGYINKKEPKDWDPPKIHPKKKTNIIIEKENKQQKEAKTTQLVDIKNDRAQNTQIQFNTMDDLKMEITEKEVLLDDDHDDMLDRRESSIGRSRRVNKRKIEKAKEDEEEEIPMKIPKIENQQKDQQENRFELEKANTFLEGKNERTNIALLDEKKNNNNSNNDDDDDEEL
ncbi:probable ATP-dependent helicase PF08_0048 [Palaemon carinicauda]|uniref:probable ATP-dependent helicase PF08_0048 n=1 Tax=Palaemon carinicauda TaxID=392227 RepID=UPI0035B5F319